MLLFGKALSRVLLANGLALAVGPFCVLAQAQDYIDLEAERAAAEGRPASTSSARAQAAQPAQAYPVTSYGIGTSARPEQSAATAPTATATPAPVAASGSNAGQLVLQVQQLQQEVMRLNGIVEEQAHELRTLKSQSLERYLDIDRRLSLLAGGSVDEAALLPTEGTTAPGSGPAAAPSVAASAAAAQPTAAQPTAAQPQPGESAAYQAAYGLVREQKFDEAVSAFQQFLRDYPAGRFTPNAHYWLGELYLVTTPPDVEAARQSFMLLLDLYPADSKVPDALFKLGKIHYTKGNRDRAREFLDRVINEYESSNSAAVKLAQDFINDNY